MKDEEDSLPMDNSPESTKNSQVDFNKSGIKAYSAAVRTGIIGGVGSFLLALLAVLTVSAEGGDSAGLGFFIFGFLAIAVLIISGFIAILLSLVGIINGTAALNQKNNSKEETIKQESIIGITKNVGLILGIILILLIVFKILKSIW
jgi:Na+/melibiose symporter-like transporter